MPEVANLKGNTFPRRRAFVTSWIFGLLFFSITLAYVQSYAAELESSVIPLESVREQEGVTDLVLRADGIGFSFKPTSSPVLKSGKVFDPILNDTIDEPGLPSLPIFATYIALPPGAEAAITISEPGRQIYAGQLEANVEEPQFTELPFNRQAFDEAEGLTPETLNHQAPPEEQRNGDGSYYPSGLFELSEPIYLRNLRLVRLRLFPYRYNQAEKKLVYSSQLDVKIRFQNQEPIKASAVVPSNASLDFLEPYRDLILNAKQVDRSWLRYSETMSYETKLPVNKDVYKIEVNETGIYEISLKVLQDAGLDIGQSDPTSIRMLYRGDDVAYQYIDDGDGIASVADKIRFFGTNFNGSRLERQFVQSNVYWLWFGSQLTTTIPVSPSINGTNVSTVKTSVTREEDIYYYATYTDLWDTFPNEPDSWYWDSVRLWQIASRPVVRQYTIDLHAPAESGPPAIMTIEFGSSDGSDIDFYNEVTLGVNGLESVGAGSWWGENNINITATVPISGLIDGTNVISITYDSTGGPWIVLNRITVDYLQNMRADNDQLIFIENQNGASKFNVTNFSEGARDNVIIWDITEARSPIAIDVDSIEIFAGDSGYTYTFGVDHKKDSSFIVTVADNILTPTALSRYVPVNLDPSNGGADWIAIAPSEFMQAATRLANHRQNSKFGGLKTKVVDIEDVVNQYGYGLATPGAVRSYLIHATRDWTRPPKYALFVGDSTLDPRRLDPMWLDKQFVPTDLVFVDRWQGQIPSDFTMSLLDSTDLDSNDLLPDISIGRISAKKSDDVDNAVNKIIFFEQNHQQWSFSWMKNLVFASDVFDGTEDFCEASSRTYSNHVASSLEEVVFCLDDNQYPSGTDMGDDLLAFVNNAGPGATFLNYRGHGSPHSWAGSGNPNSKGSIMTTSRLADWQNSQKPVIVVTGNCLDGHFAIPDRQLDSTIQNRQGLGEELLRLNASGAVVHWGSSGLGLSSWHSHIINAFYDGLFIKGLTAIGDAVNYAKVEYYKAGLHNSMLYSFVLQGDPAMQIMRPNLSLSQTPDPSVLTEAGDLVTVSYLVKNMGVYPSVVSLVDELPAEINFVSVSASRAISASLDGQQLEVSVQFNDTITGTGIPRNGEVYIDVTVQVDQEADPGNVTNTAHLRAAGLEATPGDELRRLDFIILQPDAAILPIIIKE